MQGLDYTLVNSLKYENKLWDGELLKQGHLNNLQDEEYY
jgi:hypothetical protein